jgi:predicted house-cleaning noncanonical NTP pyrophosphatase (MazG superfamily)
LTDDADEEWRMRQTFEKLVRDGIPARLDAAGVHYETRTASPDETEALLLTKLQEEVGELLAATSDADALGEIADISEVLAALASRHGADEAQMRARQRTKRDDRGGFDRGIVLCWTEAP